MPDAGPSVTLRFRIDDSGRPLSIGIAGPGYVPNGTDLAPALAASRFAAGTARRDCTIEYRRAATPLAQADIADLIRYTLDPDDGRLPRAGWDRIAPQGGDCLREPRPATLLRAFPDFARIPGTPGERQWSLSRFDLDAKGRPVGVRTVAGTGDTALDTASRKAVAASRFVAGKRTGCVYPYWREAAMIAAPAAPDTASFGAAPKCPAGPWVQPPRLTYPRAWSRRSIEGWAIVQYDVAPWGETGNVRALASEPADAFGEQAVEVVRSARRAPSATGASGCIEKVRFAIRQPTQFNENDLSPTTSD